MKAKTKQQIGKWVAAVSVVVMFFASGNYLYTHKQQKEIVEGVIIAKSDDTVKSGKYSQHSRFLFALNYPNGQSNTVEVELHTFVTKNIGDRYAYYSNNTGIDWFNFIMFTSFGLSSVLIGLCVVICIFEMVVEWFTTDE